MGLKTSIKEGLFRAWYRYVSKADKHSEILFMNYGYANGREVLDLNENDEKNRYPIQLYYHVAEGGDITDKKVLEIGCGRGGGASYLARAFKPASYHGIDLNERAIDFCSKHYKSSVLGFSQGNAMDLKFDDNSFDVIINVESSHRYPDLDKFYSEVKRVLKPGGMFLYSDFCYDWEVESIKQKLNLSGLEMLRDEVITPNVVKALRLDTPRRIKLIDKLVPFFLHKPAKEFSGVEGTTIFNWFDTRKYEYLYFVLQKK